MSARSASSAKSATSAGPGALGDNTGRSRRSLAGSVLDAALYAPLGVVAAISKGLPELAEDGRALLQQRIVNARTTGELVTTIARRRIEEIVAERSAELLGRKVSNVGCAAPQNAQAAEPQEASESPEASESADVSGSPATSAEARPNAGELAIAGYDSLAASQIIGRLHGLNDQDMARIEHYERLNRGRRTVLLKIAQLRHGAGGDHS